MATDLTRSQAAAILRAAKLRDGEHRPTPVTAEALVRRGYADAIGGGGRIRLNAAGWRYARTGERLPVQPSVPIRRQSRAGAVPILDLTYGE